MPSTSHQAAARPLLWRYPAATTQHVHRGDAQDPPHEETALRAKVSGFCSQRGGRQTNQNDCFCHNLDSNHDCQTMLCHLWSTAIVQACWGWVPQENHKFENLPKLPIMWLINFLPPKLWTLSWMQLRRLNAKSGPLNPRLDNWTNIRYSTEFEDLPKPITNATDLLDNNTKATQWVEELILLKRNWW